MRRAYSFLFFLMFMLVFAPKGYASVADLLITIDLESPVHFLAKNNNFLKETL